MQLRRSTLRQHHLGGKSLLIDVYAYDILNRCDDALSQEMSHH